jgi:1-deoxy-D-xylulose-5-phosphate reductoisomerase
MRVPIQYAITYPGRSAAPIGPLDLTGGPLTFHEPDRNAFPCLDLGYAAGRRGGSAPAVLNAADEVAVAAFLDHRIEYQDIAGVAETTLDTVEHRDMSGVGDVLAVDAEARRVAASVVVSRGR